MKKYSKENKLFMQGLLLNDLTVPTISRFLGITRIICIRISHFNKPPFMKKYSKENKLFMQGLLLNDLTVPTISRFLGITSDLKFQTVIFTF